MLLLSVTGVVVGVAAFVPILLLLRGGGVVFEWGAVEAGARVTGAVGVVVVHGANFLCVLYLNVHKMCYEWAKTRIQEWAKF